MDGGLGGGRPRLLEVPRVVPSEMLAMAPDQPDNPMLVLVSGILLLGGISLFISWGLSNAYPGG